MSSSACRYTSAGRAPQARPCALPQDTPHGDQGQIPTCADRELGVSMCCKTSCQMLQPAGTFPDSPCRAVIRSLSSHYTARMVGMIMRMLGSRNRSWQRWLRLPREQDTATFSAARPGLPAEGPNLWHSFLRNDCPVASKWLNVCPHFIMWLSCLKFVLWENK